MANTNNHQRDNDDFEEFRRQRARDENSKRFADMTDDEFKNFYVSMDKYEAIELARSPYCPSDGFRVLLDYPNDDVREVLAGRRGTEARFLSQELMKTDNPTIWRAIAENPFASPVILAALTRGSKDELTRALGAQNRSTPSDAVDDYYYEKNSNKAWGIK